MPAVSARDVFKCDWNDKDAVVALAKRFGKGMTVFRIKGRKNYNITHTERKDQWENQEVVCHV